MAGKKKWIREVPEEKREEVDERKRGMWQGTVGTGDVGRTGMAE